MANGDAPNGAASGALLDAPLEAEEPEEPAAGPVQAQATMMSPEARQLFLAGDPAAGLQAWKVGACWTTGRRARLPEWAQAGRGLPGACDPATGPAGHMGAGRCPVCAPGQRS